MLSRRERRFADRQAEKILAEIKRKNKEILVKQPKIVKPIKVTDNMLKDFKQYKDELRMQKTTGDTEPSTNTNTKR